MFRIVSLINKGGRNCVRTLAGMAQLAAMNRLVWVDLEMTGLDIDKDHIIEIACLVTEGDLQLVAQGPNIIIHQPDSVLDSMNEWCVQQHGQSGLTEAVRKSQVSVKEAEDRILDFVREHTPHKSCPLAGNSVHCDRMFLAKHMPRLIEHLHYRIVDVSSVKELCRRWYPNLADPPKRSGHRAMDDILESVEELKYYRKHIFKSHG